MIIAGGQWQVPLIKRIKEMGYEVVNTNLYPDSPGFAYADFSEVADVLDKEKNLEIAQKYNINAVVTDESDIAVPTVAYVAEKMGCPTIGKEAAELFTNKYKMRQYGSENGFHTPEFRECKTLEEAVDFFESLNRKIIIKPVDSQSSRGVFSIENVEELKEYFPISQQYSSDGKGVIAERYIQGTEFTVDGIVVNGKHYCLAISEKEHFDYNENIASRLYFTYENEKYDYCKLREEHDKLINSTGLKFGLTHSEYKYEDGEFYLIEMAARGGGTRISSDIVPYVSGIDNYEMLVKSILGKPIEDICYEDISKYNKRCAELKFLDVESNGKKIKSIRGIEKIKQIEGVKEFALEFSEGDIVEKAQDDRSRVGFFIACAENADMLKKIEDEINATLKIEFE